MEREGDHTEINHVVFCVHGSVFFYLILSPFVYYFPFICTKHPLLKISAYLKLGLCSAVFIVLIKICCM